MTPESYTSLRADKCAHIIQNISSMFGVSLVDATDIYYNSETANLIEDGVAELHCRSNNYLASVIWEEYLERTTKK